MLVRWLAPVISYTADEIWKYIPGDKDISVFLEDWYEIEAEDIDLKSRKFRWEKIILVRDEVNKQFEKLRSDGTIGSSLDAEVNIYCNEEFFNELNFIKDELRFVLICSSTNIYPLDKRNNDAIQSDISDLFIYAKPYAYEKCVRCWHRHESIGKNDMHKELCSRCISNISKDGEIRSYA
jgi:isoleucyl-tRNA synthetase